MVARLAQFEEVTANAIGQARNLRVHNPETEGDRMLSTALQNVYTNLEQASQAFRAHPSMPAKHEHLENAFRYADAAWFVSLAKDNTSKPVADRIKQLRDLISRAKSMDSDW